MDIQAIVNKRRADLARLKPLKNEHKERARDILSNAAGAIEKFADQRKVKENIRVIPGFFPTPPTKADDMVEIADLGTNDRILEPEAGAGAIAEAIRRAGFSCRCIEIHPTLVEILRRKGFDTIHGDFMDHLERYDKIIMNPPFENSQDIDHVLHAFQILNDGGRIVAIMSAGVFYREHTKARAFREWLEGVGGYWEELPAGTFQVSGTGVNACLVVINK